jgi:predicted O-methyltransferase YrrM
MAGAGRRGLLLVTAAGLLVALVVLALLGWLVGATAVVVMLLLVTIAGVAVVGGLLHRDLTKMSRGQETLLALQRRTRGLVNRRTAQLSSEYRSPELRNPDLTAVRRYAAEIAAETTKSFVRQQQLHLDTQRELQAQLNLLQLLRFHGAVPAMGGAEASAGLHLLSVDALLRHRPTALVQTGGGTSALLLGLASAQYDLGTRLVVLEHRPDVVAGTRALAARHGVQDRLEIRDPADGLDDLTQVGLVVVTGPFATASQAGDRLRSTLTDLVDRLTPTCTIVFDGTLDESVRPAELSSDFSTEVASTARGDVTVWTRCGS